MDHHRQQEASNSSYGLVVPPPVGAAPLNSDFFGSNELLMPMPEGVLMVWDAVQDMEVGVVVKLGTRCLVFEYFGQWLPMEKTGHLDLMTESGLYLSHISYELAFSEPVEEEDDPSPIPIRRAFLKLGALTSIQRTALETLITIYATPNA